MSSLSRVFIALALLAANAPIERCLADNLSDWRDCRSQNLDLNIPACTRIIENAASSGTDRIEGYVQRGFAYLSQNASISAQRDFDKAIGQQADNVRALAGRAITRFRRGETAQSILDYSLATRIDATAVDALASTQQEIPQIAAAARQSPPPQAQLDSLYRQLIRCGPGTRQDGLSCVPVTCADGQRLQGSSCVEIVCGPGTQRQGSTCVAIAPPPAAPPPPPPPIQQPPRQATLLIAASSSRWCTSRREYWLSFDGDRIVWRDSFGAMDVERIVEDNVSFARTVTVDSRRTQGTVVPRGTVWHYRSSGHGRIDVSRSGGGTFSLTRC